MGFCYGVKHVMHYPEFVLRHEVSKQSRHPERVSHYLISKQSRHPERVSG